MPRDDDHGYTADDGRCYDEDGYDVTDEVEHRECHACGGTPTFREGARLYPCSDCGEDCCSTCLDRKGTCDSCNADANERDELDHVNDLARAGLDSIDRAAGTGDWGGDD